jgi:hypothetical protein
MELTRAAPLASDMKHDPNQAAWELRRLGFTQAILIAASSEVTWLGSFSVAATRWHQ